MIVWTIVHSCDEIRRLLCATFKQEEELHMYRRIPYTGTASDGQLGFLVKVPMIYLV